MLLVIELPDDDGGPVLKLVELRLGEERCTDEDGQDTTE